MKITRIAGYNIASLAEPFELDFTQPPLSETDIFAITGPTGAGKSTLFDVICLALYDKSPRLDHDERNDSYFDEDGSIINGRDARTLMHRGAAECLAEVSFVVAGRSYTARRRVRRARNKPKGRMQPSEMTLINEQTGETFKGNKKEILGRIQEVIGLSFEQFTRAVMLAQGDFASFLRARDDHKSDILMRITGKESYKAISKAIYEHHKEKRLAFEALQEKAQQLDLLSPEAEQEREKEIAVLHLELQNLGKRHEWLVVMEEVLRAFSDYASRLSAGKDYLYALQPAFEALPAREFKLKHHRDVVAARAAQTIVDKSRSAIVASEKEAVAVREEIVVLQQRLAAFDAKMATSDNALFLLETHYKEKEPLQREAEEKEKALREAVGERSELMRRLGELIKEAESVEKKIAVAQQQWAQTEERLAELRAWFSVRSKLEPYIGEGKTMLAHLATIKDRRRIIALQKEIGASARQHFATLTESLDKVEKEMAQLEKVLPENIYHLRKGLTVGHPCPVCGSKQHPLLGRLENAVGANTEEIERLRQKAKTEKTNIERQCNEEVHREKEALKRRAEEVAILKTLYAENKEALEILLGAPFTETSDADKARAYLTDLLRHWESNSASRELIVRSFEDESKALQEQRALLGKMREEIVDTRGRIEVLEAGTSRLSEEIFRLLGCSDLVTYERTVTERRAALVREKALLSTASAAESGKLEEKRKRLEALEAALPEMCSRLEQEQAELMVLQAKLSPVTAELIFSSSAEVEAEEKAIAALRGEYKKAETIVAEREADIATLKGANADFAFPQSPEAREEVHACIERTKRTTQEELNTVTRKLAEAELSLKMAKERTSAFQVLRKEMEGKRQELALWARLSEHYGSSSGDSFNIRAQGFTLDQLIEFANLQLKSIAPRYKLRRVPRTLALEVIDLDMMEQCRAVNSLSGGETFLVSLALSLALSQISSFRLQIGSLFIDEGFGTLDEATLSAAMDALELLRRSGRTIGIISHVKEMTRRLPVRIEVSKSGQGQSKVSIVGSE